MKADSTVIGKWDDAVLINVTNAADWSIGNFNGKDLVRFFYDGFDRRVATLDMGASLSVTHFDPLDNPRHIIAYGRNGLTDAATQVRLAESCISTNVLGQTYQTAEWMGIIAGTGDGCEWKPSLSPLSTWTPDEYTGYLPDGNQNAEEPWRVMKSIVNITPGNPHNIGNFTASITEVSYTGEQRKTFMDPLGQVIIEEVGAGQELRKMHYGYDSVGQRIFNTVTAVSDISISTSVWYDAFGQPLRNVRSITDSLGNFSTATRSYYNAFGEPYLTSSSHSGDVKSITTRAGISTLINKHGNVSRAYVDSRGMVVKTEKLLSTNPADPPQINTNFSVDEYAYRGVYSAINHDGKDLPILNTNEGGYNFDALIDVEETNADFVRERSRITGYESESDGKISEQREFDFLGRLIKRIDDNGGVTEYTYTQAREWPDEEIRTGRFATRVKSASYMADGLPVSSETTGTRVFQEFDAQGQLIRMRPNNANATVDLLRQYDGLGRLVRATFHNDPSDPAKTVSTEIVTTGIGLPVRQTQWLGDSAQPAHFSTVRLLLDASGRVLRTFAQLPAPDDPDVLEAHETEFEIVRTLDTYGDPIFFELHFQPEGAPQALTHQTTINYEQTTRAPWKITHPGWNAEYNRSPILRPSEIDPANLFGSGNYSATTVEQRLGVVDGLGATAVFRANSGIQFFGDMMAFKDRDGRPYFTFSRVVKDAAVSSLRAFGAVTHRTTRLSYDSANRLIYSKVIADLDGCWGVNTSNAEAPDYNLTSIHTTVGTRTWLSGSSDTIRRLTVMRGDNSGNGFASELLRFSQVSVADPLEHAPQADFSFVHDRVSWVNSQRSIEPISESPTVTKHRYESGRRSDSGRFRFEYNAYGRIIRAYDRSQNPERLLAEYLYDAFGRRVQKRVHAVPEIASGLAIRYRTAIGLYRHVHGPTGQLIRDFHHIDPVGQYDQHWSVCDAGLVQLVSTISVEGGENARYIPHYPLRDISNNLIGYLRPDFPAPNWGSLRMVKIPEPELFGRLPMVWTTNPSSALYPGDGALDVLLDWRSQALHGQNFDYEIGMQHVGWRHYDPNSGAFISEDPLGAWGDPFSNGNPYAAFSNNPAMFGDASGGAVNFIAGAVGAAIGFAASTLSARFSGKSWKESLAEGFIGAGTRFLIGATFGALALAATAWGFFGRAALSGAVEGGITGAVSSYFGAKITGANDEQALAQAMMGGLIGTGLGAIFGAAGDAVFAAAGKIGGKLFDNVSGLSPKSKLNNTFLRKKPQRKGALTSFRKRVMSELRRAAEAGDKEAASLYYHIENKYVKLRFSSVLEDSGAFEITKRGVPVITLNSRLATTEHAAVALVHEGRHYIDFSIHSQFSYQRYLAERVHRVAAEFSAYTREVEFSTKLYGASGRRYSSASGYDEADLINVLVEAYW